MSSSSSDIFDRLSMFRNNPGSGSSTDNDDHPDDHSRPKIDPATSRVKRCLFGRGNHEENIRFAKRELEKSYAESKRKWNFDFVNERPMEGRFEWQSSPYPMFKKKNISKEVASAENVENLKPENPSSNEHTSTNASDADQNCDLGNKTNVEESDSSPQSATSADIKEAATASSMPASGSSSSSNQRTSSRQSSIAGKILVIFIHLSINLKA